MPMLSRLRKDFDKLAWVFSTSRFSKSLTAQPFCPPGIAAIVAQEIPREARRILQGEGFDLANKSSWLSKSLIKQRHLRLTQGSLLSMRQVGKFNSILYHTVCFVRSRSIGAVAAIGAKSNSWRPGGLTKS